MPEEQESLSLSENTANTVNSANYGNIANTTDNVADVGSIGDIDDPDDTIKIQRVKLPLHGYHPFETDKSDTADAKHHSLAGNGNGNGHVGATDAINRFRPEEQPFFEELTLEETAKLPPLSAPTQTYSAQPARQSRNVPSPLRAVARLWKFSRLLCTGVLLIPIIAVGFYAYTQFNRFQSNLYTVDAQTGTVLWQHPTTGAEQTELVDAQGSVQVVTLANNEQQVVALDARGSVLWQSFSSDGIFAVPSVQAAPGTVLATLSEQTAPGHSLALYSFNRATGHINWQYEITQPAQAQSADILGADTHFIYALNTQPLAGGQTQVQLLAINRYTGYIGWRVNSPAEAGGKPLDPGTLLLTGQEAVWQVKATIVVMDETQGNVLWSASLPFSNSNMFQQEEAQMVALHGQLVVERDDILHAFDLTTGKKRWDTEVFDFATGTIPASIAAAGQTILVYGNGQLAALSLADQHVIWQQRQIGNILGLHVSNEGTLIYAIILNSVEDSVPAQALVAFGVQNGGARWTFQLSDQYSFLHPQADGFQYHQNVILTTLCVTANCNHPHLYALNATTGATLWKFEGNGVSNPLMSSDGSVVSYEGNTSGWQQFVQRISG